MADETTQSSVETDRAYGVAFNNRVWELLAKPERSRDEDEELIHAAHASYLHWCVAGTALHRQRGLWMISHVYAQLGFGERALHYARKSATLSVEYEKLMRDFDLCYASEAMARAHAVLGEHGEASKHFALAYRAGKKILGEKDKEIFLGDLNEGNWGDFQAAES